MPVEITEPEVSVTLTIGRLGPTEIGTLATPFTILDVAGLLEEAAREIRNNQPPEVC